MHGEHQSIDYSATGPDRAFDDFHIQKEFNPMEDARTAFFKDGNLARVGLRADILRRQNSDGVFFITTLANSGEYKQNKQPTVNVGEIDLARLNDSELLHTAEEDHLLVPVKSQCEFYLTLKPCEVDNSYTEVRIVKSREGFRARIFLGNKDALIDVVTKPALATSESFVAELSRLYGPAADDRTEQLRQVTNEIFHLLSF